MIPLLTPSLPSAPAASVSPSPHPSVPPSLSPVPQLPADYFLPDGTPLHLTLFKKAKLAALLSREGADFTGPQDQLQDLILLFFAAHPREVWSAPGPAGDGTMRPLYARPDDLEAALEHWSTGPACRGLSLPAMSRLAGDLWHDAHRNFVIPLEKKTGNETPATHPPERLQGGFISTSTSSPEAMPAAPATSSTSCPSAMPTDSSTHGSTPMASTPSLPPNSSAASPPAA